MYCSLNTLQSFFHAICYSSTHGDIYYNVDKKFALSVTCFPFFILSLGPQTYQDWHWPVLAPAQHWWLRMSMILTDRRACPLLREATRSRPSNTPLPAVARPPQSHSRPQTCSLLLRPPPPPRRRPSLPSLLDQAVRYTCDIFWCVCMCICT